MTQWREPQREDMASARQKRAGSGGSLWPYGDLGFLSERGEKPLEVSGQARDVVSLMSGRDGSVGWARQRWDPGGLGEGSRKRSWENWRWPHHGRVKDQGWGPVWMLPVGKAVRGGEWRWVSGQNPTPPGCASGRIWLPSTWDGRTKAGAVWEMRGSKNFIFNPVSVKCLLDTNEILKRLLPNWVRINKYHIHIHQLERMHTPTHTSTQVLTYTLA